jgi:aminocarboxymuconate-semialdehyde decarboxylase
MTFFANRSTLARWQRILKRFWYFPGGMMRNRREFIKTVAGVTAGALVMGREIVSAQGRGGGGRGGPGRGPANANPPSGPVPRRIVQVGGKRVRVVDIHAHATVPTVAPVIQGTPFERNGAGRAMGDERIWEMDKRGIDIQALSINGYWWYEIKDRGLADNIVRAADEGLAAWVKQHPDRFVALSSPSLQFPDLAAAQLEHAVKDLGLRGASLGGHVNGESLSDPKYDVFWAKCQELNVPVFEHPGGADNVLKENAWAGTKGDLGNIIGNPLETTVFFSRLIFDGTLDKFPNLKIIGAHGGGYLPSYLGRTDVACQVRGNANCANKKQPADYFKDQLMVDAMVFSPEDVRHLVAKSGPSQVVYGTDIPIYQWPDAVDPILQAELPDAQKEMILGGTLTKLLKLDPFRA